MALRNSSSFDSSRVDASSLLKLVRSISCTTPERTVICKPSSAPPTKLSVSVIHNQTRLFSNLPWESSGLARLLFNHPCCHGHRFKSCLRCIENWSDSFNNEHVLINSHGGTIFIWTHYCQLMLNIIGCITKMVDLIHGGSWYATPLTKEAYTGWFRRAS